MWFTNKSYIYRSLAAFLCVCVFVYVRMCVCGGWGQGMGGGGSPGVDSAKVVDN